MATATETADNHLNPYVWRIAPVIVLGTIMSILDTTIVNVALDTLGRELHATLSSIQWVVTGYMLALAAVIPISGWASRKLGAKNVWLFSVLMFTLGSALCGLATSPAELIAFRVLQGIGGGMIMPVGQLMMATAAGPKNMGKVTAITGVPAMLAPILGPTIGGAILQVTTWRWIFFVNVPIGIIAIIAGLRLIHASERKRDEPALDFVGLALMATGLPLFTYGLAEIGSLGTFNSPKVIFPIIAGVVLIAGFVWHALRARRPLLQLHLYQRPSFSSAAVCIFLVSAAMFGSMILFPLYWQNVRHMSVIDTGLLSAPQGLGMALVMPFAGKLTDRHGGGVLALIGVGLTTLFTLPLALLGAHTSIVYLMAMMFLRGIGIAFAFVPTMTAAYASLRSSELSDATPQLNVLQRVGGSIGTAILAVVLQRATSGAHTAAAAAGAFGTAFWWALGMTAFALLPCIWLLVTERRARAARSDDIEHLALDSGAVVEALA
ncbi:MAG TPA: DHA2 family efflux MFS transporter permease subunit [Solirubrobacteraceae bacterium]|jgi:EmrB/QacA subfamily drug resistance transporter|nr:DHA2 family efflux MFS transporter permease subunit [Solirubrobacteraceae bacterium]